MFHALLLDWMPGSNDGLIVAVIMGPSLIVNGLLVTAIPGIMIGVFTARKVEGPPIGPNFLFGSFAGMAIEAIAYFMHWWPYSSNGGPLLTTFVFRSLLPIWLIANLASKMLPSGDD